MWTPHRFSCRISTLDTGLNKGKIWNLRLPPAYDLVRKCKISYPCACGRTCASAEAERTADYRMTGLHPLLQKASTVTGVIASSIAFAHCHPALCVSNLADFLLVSHFELLVPVVCSFLASSRLFRVLDVSLTTC